MANAEEQANTYRQQYLKEFEEHTLTLEKLEASEKKWQAQKAKTERALHMCEQLHKKIIQIETRQHVVNKVWYMLFVCNSFNVCAVQGRSIVVASGKI
jgi:hypothetical protein